MEVSCNFDTINSIDMLQKFWTIRVVVLRKGNVEVYKTSKGSGSMLKVILMDDEGTQIQAVLFNETISRLNCTLDLHKAYKISNGIVSRVNPQYPNCHKERELKFTTETTIEVDEMEEITLEMLSFKFIEFEDIKNYTDQGERIDAMGIVIGVQPILQITKKNNNGITFMRRITIMDMNSRTVFLTLWGDLAENEGNLLMEMLDERPIITVTCVALNNYQGVNLQTQSASTLQINLKINQVVKLRKWYEENITSTDINALITSSKNQLFGEADKLMLNEIVGKPTISFKKKHYYFKATIIEIQNATEPWYNACNKCTKKIQVTENGAKCERCIPEITKCYQRFMMRIRVKDSTGEANLTIFDDSVILTHYTIDKLLDLKVEEEETNEFYEAVTSCKGKSFSFLLEINNTQSRLLGDRFVPLALKEDCLHNDDFEDARAHKRMKC